VNADPADIEKIAQAVNLDLLQFHGDETVAECDRFERPYIKAIRMREELDLDQLSNEYQNASGLLLDAYDKKLFGGTGKSFDWSMIPDQRSLPIILAGGLNPENVGQAINDVHPYAVDVSGGVEASKGIKDKEKMNVFMKGVNSVRS
jgi:phosphoribosylanthranilate isomerase